MALDVGSISDVLGPLLSAISNPETLAKLQRLSDKLAKFETQAATKQQPSVPQRRPGWLKGAVTQVLAESEEPMRAKNIHATVAALLGETVSWSSVKDCLAKHAAGEQPRFVRVARGRYALLVAP